jgi:membrane protein
VAGRPVVRRHQPRLDTAYHIRHQRLSMTQRLIALGFAFVSVVVVVLTLGIMVDAPFLDEQRDLALQFGVSRAVAAAWYVGRWPVVLLVLVGFLLCLYRFAPSVSHAWRHLVPGAILGVLLWTYFSSVAILVGNELNAELARLRGLGG